MECIGQLLKRGQTLGALIAVLTVGWAFKRGDAIRELAGEAWWGGALLVWVRYVIPTAILLVGIWWLLTELLGAVDAV